MHPGTTKSLYVETVIDALKEMRKLRFGNIRHFDPRPIAEEEVGLSRLDPQIGSATLIRPRVPVVQEFQALVRDAFRRHNIPKKKGLDIGSGATGYMVSTLLPPEAQSNWVQMELSPKAVAMNREANPGKRVFAGSYLQLADQGITNLLPVITGLSSLDATGHIDHAVEQIRQALKMDGLLLHVQDTRPGVTIVHQELKHSGVPAPYINAFIDDPAAQPNQAVAYGTVKDAVDVIELFRRRLGRAIEQNGGFRLEENAWMTAIGDGTNPKMNRHSELGIMLGLETNEPPINTASAVITVARRIK